MDPTAARWIALPLLLLASIGTRSVPARHELASPDGAVSIAITAGEQLTYEVTWRGRSIVAPSPIALLLADGSEVGPGAEIIGTRQRRVDETIEPIVPEKYARVRDHFNEQTLDLGAGWAIDLRAYDDGVAYRFRNDHEGDLTVRSEQMAVEFGDNPMVWFAAEEEFLTHQERVYELLRVDAIPVGQMASPPVLVALDDGPKILITESDLREYPGLYLAGTGAAGLQAVFPAYPLEEVQERDRTVRVTRREDFLARTQGPRTFPWRVFAIAEHDSELLENTLVYRLAQPSRIADPTWIHPGKVAWDWWNANNLHGVDFEAGINTETYRYYIDFAADHGIQYVILDEGWSDPADLAKINPDIDLEALLAHARSRDVGLILWVVWKSLDNELEPALDRFAAWGVSGIKVDFMQRDDQPMVDYYWRVAAAAAERHLLVDFHGAYKPTGLRRAYPNVLTREGVRGLEWVKWSQDPSPEHDVTLPFIRMFAGPMDYTPGAMLNAQQDQFHSVFDRPMSQGTRVHQLAMYVVFESPLQMLADSPSNYLREPESLAFIAGVPTTWDDTRALGGKVGDWVLVARRKGEVWYVGAMTDWTDREIELDLSFLGPGIWRAVTFEDGPNATRSASDYRRSEGSFSSVDRLTIRLAPGGGWAARIEPDR